MRFIHVSSEKDGDVVIAFLQGIKETFSLTKIEPRSNGSIHFVVFDGPGAKDVCSALKVILRVI